MHKNMHYKKIIIDIFAVTFREEGVDWNCPAVLWSWRHNVTFREEGVDWNVLRPYLYPVRIRVTFREEGVDWNRANQLWRLWCNKSPSARKVWIEIGVCATPWSYRKSPSARKVWIEIRQPLAIRRVVYRHLPRGRCGLKSHLPL